MFREKIEWPKNPVEGERFSYVDPISGADFVNWVFKNGRWHHDQS